MTKRVKPIDFVYLDVNDAFEKLTGLRKVTVLGKKISEAIPGTIKGNPELFEKYGRVALTGKSERFEIYFKPLSKWFSISVYSEQKGYFIAIFQDITHRKQVEQALRESEQRWSTTLTSIGDAVIATDIEGKITFMNAVAEELTGWTFGEAKQTPIQKVFNIINEHTRKEVTSPVTKVLNEGLIIGLANHTVLIRKDGTKVPIDDSGAPIVNDNGGISGVVLVFRDITERKKNEDALQRQAALIDLSPDAIIVRALDGTITFWSKGAEKLYGWTKEEAIGKCTHTLFQTEFPEPFDSIMGKLKLNKKWSGELVHRTKSGKEVFVQSWWQAEETEHGKIKSILESNVDITKRKKSEVKIRESEEMLKRSQEIAHLGSWELDVKENQLIWSDQVYRIFGLKPQEFAATYEAFLASVHPDDREAVDKAYSSSIIQGKEGYNIEHRVIRKDTGEIRVVHEKCSHFRDGSGQVIKSLGMVHDITDRKKDEKEIERLASFPTLNPNPVIEVGINDEITYLNPAAKKLFPDIETAGLTHVFFSNWKNVTEAFRDQNINTFGREVKISNHWYHQQFYLVPQTYQIRIYTTDIEDLKKTEEARAKVQTKLEENAVMLEEYASQMEELAEQRAQQLQNAERLAAIGQTAGMVGHDIRNPLQAITGDMYLISEELKTIKDIDSKRSIMESIESVNQNLSYINKIVSDLQDYTRPLKPSLQDANLAELIEGTLLTITVPKGIEVTTDVAANAKPIRTDVAYMRRILTNLMTNAVQAMQEEGKLTVQASKKKDAVVLTVEDTGVGIPDEVKSKMFTPLFTTKSKGQGLGLAVVKRLVEALNGTITFESTAGKGTKFTVELPQKTLGHPK
ncbi:MAG TPA: PAS domain S-box protein [Candidatus Acidoferrales bacterium]|nr:PAS domain S-box protein [Candidatus Acidoferrales bacterium]